MRTKTQTRRGLSLIELMIVVSVLAILAAIVVPRYTNANDTAKGSALATQLSTVKKALELYKTEHNGNYPTTAQLITSQWQVLTNSTDMTGDVSGSDFGPYIPKSPRNGFIDSTAVAADNSGAWQYNPTTGQIQAVVPQAIYDRAAELQLNTNDLVVEP